MIHHTAFIHTKAHVDRDTVKIGAGTKVWQFASITRGTVLGEDCAVSPGAMLDGSIYGDRVRIGANFAAGAGFKVGNDVFIGPNVVLCNDMWPRVDRDGYDEERLRGGVDFAVYIGDNVSIGAGAIILPGVAINDGCIVAAGAVVEKSLLPGTLFKRDGNWSPIKQHGLLVRDMTRMRFV